MDHVRLRWNYIDTVDFDKIYRNHDQYILNIIFKGTKCLK